MELLRKVLRFMSQIIKNAFLCVCGSFDSLKKNTLGCSYVLNICKFVLISCI